MVGDTRTLITKITYFIVHLTCHSHELTISEHLAHVVEQSDIGPIALSYHVPVTLEMQRSLSWKMNASLLHDDNFVKFLETQTDFCLIVS